MVNDRNMCPKLTQYIHGVLLLGNCFQRWLDFFDLIFSCCASLRGLEINR
jgi:hypothetical protein